MSLYRNYDRDLYIDVLEAEVIALKTRLDHVLKWSYRNHSLKNIAPETVDLMIDQYIRAHEAERNSISTEL